jgi:hypothetical protein
MVIACPVAYFVARGRGIRHQMEVTIEFMIGPTVSLIAIGQKARCMFVVLVVVMNGEVIHSTATSPILLFSGLILWSADQWLITTVLHLLPKGGRFERGQLMWHISVWLGRMCDHTNAFMSTGWSTPCK